MIDDDIFTITTTIIHILNHDDEDNLVSYSLANFIQYDENEDFDDGIEFYLMAYMR